MTPTKHRIDAAALAPEPVRGVGVGSLVSRMTAHMGVTPARRVLILYAALYGSSTALLKLSGLVLLLWLARTLSVAEYGVLGLWYALQTFMSTVALAGIVEATVGLINNNRGATQQRALFAAANSSFAIMSGLATIVAVIVHWAFLPVSDGDLLTLASVVASGLLLAFASLQAQVLRLQERHVASLSFSFVVPLAGFIGGAIAFLIAPAGLSVFFAGTALGTAAALAAQRLFGVGFYVFAVTLAETRAIFVGAIAFIAIAVMGWLSGYGNNYIVQIFFNSAEVARYTFVLMVSSLMPMVAAALNQVWSPRFFKLVHDAPAEIAEQGNRQFFRWLGLVLGLAGGTLIACYPAALDVIGGNLVAYKSMRLELFFLVAAYVLITPWWHCYNYYLVHGAGAEAMRISLATSIAGIAVWAVLMWTMGSLGIYIGFLTQMLIKTATIVLLAKRRWPITVAWDGVVGGMVLALIGLAVSSL